MATNTENLELYKKDPVNDSNDYFDVKSMLNDNWDKIDEKYRDIDDKLKDAQTEVAKKVELVVSENNVPVDERKEGTLYFFVTDEAAAIVDENIKVSPTMGVKRI